MTPLGHLRAAVVAFAVGLLVCDGVSAQVAEGREALEAGRWADALKYAAGEPDLLVRARLRSDTYFRARDFGAVIAVAGEGALHRLDPHLQWRAAAAALWLRDGVAAQQHLTMLRTACDAGSLEPDLDAFYRGQAELFAADGRALVEGRTARELAVRRARIFVFAGGLVWLLGGAWLLRSTPRG